MNKFPKYKDLNAFYGKPDANGDGQPDPKWESENLIRVIPPYPMVWSWSNEPVKSIRLHKKCARAFENSLKEIGKQFDHAFLVHHQLDQCGGGYNFRPMREAERLSVHAWGAALDLATKINWHKRKWAPGLGMMPKEVVNIFAKNGIRWGGLWERADAQHFEATSR
jgi:glyoxylase-like metal-dependent hydrolase (beta-lactamase superfamily II)